MGWKKMMSKAWSRKENKDQDLCTVGGYIWLSKDEYKSTFVFGKRK